MTRDWTITYDDARGDADFGWVGRCTFEARDDGLLVRVDAADPVRRRLLQRVVGSHLERFGRRDGLVVRWNPGAHLDT